ncbi:MAG: hypothetical protein HY901_12100 [Deltaproteobacteria bacterium]|nr:hypothetical protein [Deltaproteobacteria bacterium]
MKIEIHHPEGAERVQLAALPDWFEVDWKRGGAVPIAVQLDERELDWADALADTGARAVFVHLAKHGSVTEAEVTKMVGSPRAFRRFSLDFEEHARKVPFRVRIETAADGKRYVKEGEK